jgi:23S rRNA (uracil1939-C5)-methyltransferase
VRLDFRPTDFTQVNVHINRLLIRRAMQLLDPQPGERIADLFCGLGNFSLPIARLGARGGGGRGQRGPGRARAANAARNGLAGRCEFHAANLFETTEDSLAALGPLDKLLIDPPREGAIAVVKAIDRSARRRASSMCRATRRRWRATPRCWCTRRATVLAGAGIANMFPQTSHVESVALFEQA